MPRRELSSPGQPQRNALQPHGARCLDEDDVAGLDLLGQQDFDVTGPTGAMVPVPAPYLDNPGYEIEGDADVEVPLGIGEEPLEPGPYDDPYDQ